MYCFGKFCCMCLCYEKKSFFDMNFICKDNMCLFDKITYCLHQELQDIIKYKIGDAKVCIDCRNQILRLYRFVRKTKENLSVIKSYAEKLSENDYNKTVGTLQVAVNTPKKKIKRKKSVYHAESNDKTNEICVLRLPLPSIEDRLQYSEKTDDCIDVKSVIDINDTLNLIYFEQHKIEQDDIVIKLDYSTKSETLDNSEEEFSLHINELSVKEEFDLQECNRSSPVDKTMVHSSTDEDTFNNETLPLSEPVENKTNLETPSNAAKEVVNTNNEIEKRRKPVPFPCPLCKSTFYSANAMARHLSKQHNKSRFKCTFCNLSFKSEIVLKRHILIHSDELYNCKI